MPTAKKLKRTKTSENSEEYAEHEFLPLVERG